MENISKYNLPFLFECTIDRIKLKARTIQNVLWKEVFNTWANFRQITDPERTEESSISNLKFQRIFLFIMPILLCINTIVLP